MKIYKVFISTYTLSSLNSRTICCVIFLKCIPTRLSTYPGSCTFWLFTTYNLIGLNMGVNFPNKTSFEEADVCLSFAVKTGRAWRAEPVALPHKSRSDLCCFIPIPLPYVAVSKSASCMKQLLLSQLSRMYPSEQEREGRREGHTLDFRTVVCILCMTPMQSLL